MGFELSLLAHQQIRVLSAVEHGFSHASRLVRLAVPLGPSHLDMWAVDAVGLALRSRASDISVLGEECIDDRESLATEGV